MNTSLASGLALVICLAAGSASARLTPISNGPIVKAPAAAPPAAAKIAPPAAHPAPKSKMPDGSVTVRLPDAPRDGMRWTVVRTDRSLGYPTKQWVHAPAKGGEMRLTWQQGPFTSPGEKHSVTLAYGKAGQPPTKTKEVVVKFPPIPLAGQR